MSLGIGRLLKSNYGVPIAGALAIGAAVASLHPLKGATDFAMNVAFGDKQTQGDQVDNMILGRDLHPSELFGMDYPGSSVLNFLNYGPGNIRLAARGVKDSLNRTTMGDMGYYDLIGSNLELMKSYKTTANAVDQANLSYLQQGYTQDPYAASLMHNPYGGSLPFNNSVVKSGVYAQGDQVFGMYNSRFGPGRFGG